MSDNQSVNLSVRTTAALAAAVDKVARRRRWSRSTAVKVLLERAIARGLDAETEEQPP
ncbi:MAG: hypothetical protein LBQ06_01225 [Frankiaceae bacterium]|jgi:predicted transcriptional regulator|nr:hypothetical protein [Frankiaceae bacterium]